MRIVVCIKQVPATNDAVIDPETKRIVREGVQAILNPFDTYAIEEALRSRLAFYGQLEHARLLQLERQLDLLDGAAGTGVAAEAQKYAAAHDQARAASRELAAVRDYIARHVIV